MTRSENSAYSSSVNRVLITRWRWGVLYLFMAVNLLSWVDFFKRRKPQKGGLGVATPTRFPQDKMSRQAKFGTVVESCSKKLPYRPSNHYYNLKRAFWQRYGYIFRKSPLNPYYNGTGISAKGNGKIFEKGCKKSSKSFQTYCLCAAVIGGGLFSCNS